MQNLRFSEVSPAAQELPAANEVAGPCRAVPDETQHGGIGNAKH